MSCSKDEQGRRLRPHCDRIELDLADAPINVQLDACDIGRRTAGQE
jgi:hypothetical protein